MAEAATVLNIDRDALRAKYAEEREKRLRVDGSAQYRRLESEFAELAADPYTPVEPRDPVYDHVTFAFVGGGFAGLVVGARLKVAGIDDYRIIEKGGDFGGTWYWNRYPGARCDIQTIDYSYTFDPDLENSWQWSEKYATQPEILRYLGFVADRYDLRRDIRFGEKVTGAKWDQAEERWKLTTDKGATISCRYYIMATGCLSAPKPPEIDGVKDFKGEVYFTGR